MSDDDLDKLYPNFDDDVRRMRDRELESILDALGMATNAARSGIDIHDPDDVSMARMLVSPNLKSFAPDRETIVCDSIPDGEPVTSYTVAEPIVRWTPPVVTNNRKGRRAAAAIGRRFDD